MRGLGEDLVLFRAGRGRAGLLDAHASEHLATSDRAVIMTRKMVKKAIDAVTRGDDPAGVIRDPKLDVVRTTAGDAVVAAAAERS